tara:strand:- start:509 stop:1261 length:753 start_codon:yes stop_codon:yes gene_type:complete
MHNTPSQKYSSGVMMIPRGVPLYSIAWAAALLPFIASHVSYLLAASAGHVEWCMPYWDSCTSISATGRELPEKIWFKLVMIPGALLSMLFWYCIAAWRRQAADTRLPKSLWSMPLLGTIAALSLIVYTIALGEEGDAYQNLRRTGVVLAFAFTYLAQLLLTRLIGELGRLKNDRHLLLWHSRLFALSSLLLAVGVFSLILDAMLGTDYDRVEDAFEWILALLLNCYFAAVALCLRHDPAVLSLQINKTRP